MRRWVGLLLGTMALLPWPATVSAVGKPPPAVRTEEVALTRRGGELAVFDRAVLRAPGQIAWPLLGAARRLHLTGARLLARRGGVLLLAARHGFTLTYTLPIRGESMLLVRRFPAAVDHFVVFTGQGVVGSGTALPKPRTIERVRVGRLTLTAFAFGRMARGSVLRWQILVGDSAASLGQALVGAIFLLLALGLFLVFRYLGRPLGD